MRKITAIWILGQKRPSTRGPVTRPVRGLRPRLRVDVAVDITDERFECSGWHDAADRVSCREKFFERTAISQLENYIFTYLLGTASEEECFP